MHIRLIRESRFSGPQREEAIGSIAQLSRRNAQDRQVPLCERAWLLILFSDPSCPQSLVVAC
jgi:hypothetical protein